VGGAFESRPGYKPKVSDQDDQAFLMRRAVYCSVKVTLLFTILILFAGCGRDREVDTPQVQPRDRPPAVELTAERLLAHPDLLHERLRQTNPGYRGGAMVAVQPRLGLVGQINTETVTDLSSLQGVAFGALDLRGTHVTDISPLKGMPLFMLGLEGTRVTDLRPIGGARLKRLYLNDTPVADLAPLKGMLIEELMLVNTRVSDVSPLKGMPLKMLWLSNTPVSNIEPIADCPLLSLTLEGTRVDDLSPLSGHPTLERLHIGKTAVTDLSAIKDLKLTRLIFTPAAVTNGLDAVRSMSSLREVGTTLESRMSPTQFWQSLKPEL
jgi:hypothetical protein